MDRRALFPDLIQRGAVLMKKRKYREAREAFQKALKLRPDSAGTCVCLGKILTDLGEMEEAAAMFRRAAELDGTLGEAWFGLAGVCYLREQWQEAAQYYLKAEEAGCHAPNLYLFMGNSFYNCGDTEQALRYTSRAVEEQPLSEALWRQKLLLELELGKTDEALDTLDAFESTLPDAVDVHEIRTRLLIEQHEYDRAEACLSRARAAFPEDVRIGLLCAHLYAVRGRLEEAEREIAAVKEKAATPDERKRVVWEEADLFLRKEEPQRIVGSVRWGLEAAPDDTDLLSFLLQFYIDTQDYAHVIEMADGLRGREETEPSVRASAEFYAAAALRESGKEEEAEGRFRMLSKSLEGLDGTRGKDMDLLIYRILTYNALREYGKALELAGDLGALSPNPADVHAFRALIYKDMGQEQKAREEKELARQADPALADAVWNH